ncbi:hypothetical protein V6Z12_D05G288400 [Gossypium hirsutum]
MEVCLSAFKQWGSRFRRLKDHNKSFLLKLRFCVLANRNDLWVRILREKYHVGDIIPDSVIKGSASFFWRSLAKIWDDLHPDIYPTIGDGKETSFWYANWIPELGPLVQHKKPRVMIPYVWKVVDAINQNYEWDWRRLDMYLSPLALLYISNVCPPNPFVGADSIAWKGAKDGVLTVSEAYARRMESTWDYKDPVWQQIWTLKCPQRVRIFLWLVCKEKLLTNAERKQRTLTKDKLCQICHAPHESILHILRDCKAIISVWKRLIPPDNQGVFFAHDFVNWFLANINKNSKFNNETFNWNTIFSIVCWFAWKQRNDSVFNDVT